MRDENGAGYATFGTDPVSGTLYLLDRTTGARVYKTKPCDICGISTWSATPEPRPCAHHQRGRVSRNDNEEAA